MWVTTNQSVEGCNSSSASVFLSGFTHNLSHRIKSLNPPLIWGYGVFPQVNGLVTTTTYNYLKRPVRLPLFNLNQLQLLKQKTCKVLLQREG